MLCDQHISHDSIPIDSRSQKKTHFMLPCYVLLQFLCTSCICHGANKTLQTFQFYQFSTTRIAWINQSPFLVPLFVSFSLRTIPTNETPPESTNETQDRTMESSRIGVPWALKTLEVWCVKVMMFGGTVDGRKIANQLIGRLSHH